MKRTAVNPWDWSMKYGFNQAEVIEGTTRHVICSRHAAANPGWSEPPGFS